MHVLPYFEKTNKTIMLARDYGRRITDSLIGRNVTILNHEQNLPRGHKLIAGDQTTITL